MLIIEGPDLIGKTTLIERLKKEMPWCGTDAFGLAESADMHAQCMKRMKRATICDRNFLSEIVYGTVLRGRSNLTRDQLGEVVAQFARVGGAMVVLSAPENVYSVECLDRHDRGEAFSREQCARVNSAYRQISSVMQFSQYFVPINMCWSMEERRDGRYVYPGSDERLVQAIVNMYKWTQS